MKKLFVTIFCVFAATGMANAGNIPGPINVVYDSTITGPADNDEFNITDPDGVRVQGTKLPDNPCDPGQLWVAGSDNDLTCVDNDQVGGEYWDRDAVNGYIYPTTLTDYVGIGTDAPTSQLELVRDGSGAYVRATSYRDSSAAGGMILQHARGTKASPSSLNTNDIIGQYLFIGRSSTGWDNTAALVAYVDGANSTRFNFLVRNSGANIEPLIIKSSGNIGMSELTPTARLHIKGPGTTSATYGFKLGNSTEDWLFGRDDKRFGVNVASPAADVDVAGGIRYGDDTTACSSSNVRTMRQQVGTNSHTIQACMQTGTSSYAWTTIKVNVW